MAIDTRAKRASMMQFGHPFIVHMIIPDGTIIQADRQHFLALYAGILVDAPVIVTVRRRVAGMMGGMLSFARMGFVQDKGS
jgi:hypothetical protein